MSNLVSSQLRRVQLRCRLLFTRPTKFVVVSNGRSGSNLLLHLLESHPRVKHCGEYFTDNRMKREDFSGRDLLSEFKHELQRKGFEKAIGAKFLYYQLESEYADRYRVESLKDVQQYVLSDTSLKIVHLTRRNLLRTVVSMLVAARTGVYRAHDVRELPQNASIEIDPDNCVERMQAILDCEAKARQWFQSHQLLEMVYEDLASNQQRETSRLLKYLNVDDVPLAGRMVRQSKSLRDSVANFDALACRLAGTPFECMLVE